MSGPRRCPSQPVRNVDGVSRLCSCFGCWWEKFTGETGVSAEHSNYSTFYSARLRETRKGEKNAASHTNTTGEKRDDHGIFDVRELDFSEDTHSDTLASKYAMSIVIRNCFLIPVAGRTKSQGLRNVSSIFQLLLFIQQDCEKHESVRSTQLFKTTKPVRSETTIDSSTLKATCFL